MPIVAVIILRAVQLVGLLGIWIGLQQTPALVGVVNDILQRAAWTWPNLCMRIVAVTGPLLLSSLIIGVIHWVIRTQAQKAKALASHPSEPWLANPMWAQQHIRLDNRTMIWTLSIFFAFYTLVLLPLAVASEKRPFLVFWAVLGLVLLVFVRLLWLGRKWSKSELRIATMPGVIGGPFSGVAIIRHVFDETTIFDVNLRCAQSVTRGTRKERRTELVDRWTSTQFVQKTLSGGPPGTTSIPISFAIPYDALPTTMSGTSPVQWLLTVSEKAEVNMGGATFEVPVFKTAQSSANYKPDTQLVEQYLQRIDPVTVLGRYNMKRSTVGDQQIWEFHEFNTSIFVTLIVMSLMLIGGEVALWSWITKFENFLFASMFPGIFLLMFCYGIVYMLFWRCRLVVTGNRAAPTDFVAELRERPVEPQYVIEASAGILGMRKSLSTAATPQTKLVCKLDHRVNNKEQWSIHLTKEDGESLKILSTLEGSPEAEAVAGWLAEQLNIGRRKVKPGDSFL